MKKENYISLTLTTLYKHQKSTSIIFYFPFTNIYFFNISNFGAKGFHKLHNQGKENYFFLHGSSKFAQLKWRKRKFLKQIIHLPNYGKKSCSKHM
jgi:hypothetical protein